MKVAFFDRDGTIALDYPDSVWANIDTPVLMPYAIEALKHINDIGYKVIIITNQYIIDEGYITQTQYELYNKRLLSLLKENGVEILDVFYCPHKRSDNCSCCKPKTGMIEQALRAYPQIALDNSFIVGDSVCDILLAKSLNIKSYGINICDDYEKHTNIESLKELSIL